MSTARWVYKCSSPLQLEGPFLHDELEGPPYIWQHMTHMTASTCTGEHLDAPHCSDLQHRALENEGVGLIIDPNENWESPFFFLAGFYQPIEKGSKLIREIWFPCYGVAFGGFNHQKLDFSHPKSGIHQETCGFHPEKKRTAILPSRNGINRHVHDGWILGVPACWNQYRFSTSRLCSRRVSHLPIQIFHVLVA